MIATVIQMKHEITLVLLLSERCMAHIQKNGRLLRENEVWVTSIHKERLIQTNVKLLHETG